MEYDLKNKVAFITGASSGIGRATARAFAAEGASVVLADVLKEEGLALENELRALGAAATFVECNVAVRASVEAAIQATIETYGRLDIAFNNAGIEGESGSTMQCTEENWDRVIAVNLKGVWLCMKYELEHMIKQGGGVIVNCSSIAGLVGSAGLPAYVASKHGVVGLTKSAALEFAKTNIRINAVCPGAVRTPMIDRVIRGDANISASILANQPIGRLGEPEEIADVTLWLCSPRASFVTGAAVAADGGWVA